MQLGPGAACKAIMACAVLHNICCRAGVPEPDVVEEEGAAADDNNDGNEHQHEGAGGLRAWQHLINHHFGWKVCAQQAPLSMNTNISCIGNIYYYLITI